MGMSTKLAQSHRYANYAEFQKLREKLKGTGQRDVFRLGASDIGTVLGLNEWKSSIAFFYQCCEHVPDRFTANLETTRGHIQESIAVEHYWQYMDPKDPSHEAYLENYWGKRKVYRTATKCNSIETHPDYEFLFVSKDYDINPNTYNKGVGILEVKCPRGFASSRYESNVNPSHIAQCQFQMYVSGADYAELISLDDATTPNLFQWEPIKERKEELIETCHQYVQSVLAGKKIVYSNMDEFEKEQALAELAPPEENDMKYNEFLKSRFKPENQKPEIEGSEEQLQVVVEYLRGKEEMKKVVKLENQIREWFIHTGAGRINFQSIGRISHLEKLSVPASILKKYEEAYG